MLIVPYKLGAVNDKAARLRACPTSGAIQVTNYVAIRKPDTFAR
jgi:hypothetical protein